MQREPEKEAGRTIRSCLPDNSGVIEEMGCGDGSLAGEWLPLSDPPVAMDIWGHQPKDVNLADKDDAN